ncbi:MAG: 2-oxoacid:acceptor oxidoreductase family protein [Thermodesulfobacteriota bacterium]
MGKHTEVRWHGRAQQGIVTAAKLLGESCMQAGAYVQAFPEFGPERMGAPVKAFNRVSETPIRRHCQVTNPGYVLIADPTLIAGVDSGCGLTEGADEDAVYVINTAKSPEEMRAELGLTGKPARVYTVDAAHISIECIGRMMPNTPLLGALARVTEVVPLESVIENFRKNYTKKFGDKVIEGNVKAMQRGHDEVKGL